MATWVVRQLDGAVGKVTYDEKKGLALVEMPDPAVDGNLESYLRTNKRFWIPESQRIDDYREEERLPTTDINFMKLAMNMVATQVPGVYGVISFTP